MKNQTNRPMYNPIYNCFILRYISLRYARRLSNFSLLPISGSQFLFTIIRSFFYLCILYSCSMLQSKIALQRAYVFVVSLYCCYKFHAMFLMHYFVFLFRNCFDMFFSSKVLRNVHSIFKR